MSHTPGPWRAVIRANQLGVRYVAVSQDHPGGGAWAPDIRHPTEQTAADARLIAAAPDLLGMLERIVRATLDGAIHPSDPVIRDARALLEKVRSRP